MRCFAGAMTLARGRCASVASFGVRNNLDYAGVMAGLSRKAQSHYGNQSMFGLLNRAIFNGENITYHPYVYPPFVPWVYYVTLATTAVLVTVCAGVSVAGARGVDGGPGDDRRGVRDRYADGVGAPLRRDADDLRLALVRGLSARVWAAWCGLRWPGS